MFKSSRILASFVESLSSHVLSLYFFSFLLPYTVTRDSGKERRKDWETQTGACKKLVSPKKGRTDYICLVFSFYPLTSEPILSASALNIGMRRYAKHRSRCYSIVVGPLFWPRSRGRWNHMLSCDCPRTVHSLEPPNVR